jgi:transposase
MHILKAKKDEIRRHYIAGQLNVQNIAEQLELRRGTVRFYINEFRVLEKEQPDKLHDFSFFIGKDKVTKDTAWYKNLVCALPKLIAAEKGPVIVAAELFRKYHASYPDEYSEPRFYYLFKRWFGKHEAELSAKRLAEKFTPAELAILRRWRKSNDRRLWQVAVTLMTVYTYHSFGKLAERIECTHTTMLKWLHAYEAKGLDGVNRPGNKKPIREGRKAEIERKMDDVVHLVRQSPKLHGIDKTAWTITDLAYVFGKIRGTPISISQMSLYLKRRNIRYRRSREILVSSDPQFFEKYEEIQRILGGLGEKEKFFSIDEYGPKSVRPKGGHQLVTRGELPVYQKVDKGKGWFICTCALELATNQLSWFYSRKKDTEEIIKLIDALTLEYQQQERLYLSWDAASWHDSQQLRDYLAEINEADYRLKLKTPEIVVVPLPTKTPHLNVIESVFSGMSKSVIHNSDYDSVEQCTDAIDRYFNRRNRHFRKNPQHAGNKIWGKEKVKPKFDKANICRHIG